jgi:hypothetical protein
MNVIAPPPALEFSPTAAVRPPHDERRGEPRLSGSRLRLISGRIRGGHAIILIDVSESGALIEGMRPLRPDARVEVHLAIDVRRIVVAARVVRCLVAAIDVDRGITYRAALSFERRFDWLCEAHTLLGSGMHETCSA